MFTLTAPQCACAFDCLAADRQAKVFTVTLADERVWRTLLTKFRNKRTGECWPSCQSIATAAGLSLRTVNYSIHRLREAGWLRWQRRRRWHKCGGKRFWTQDSNLYELRIPRRWRRVISECKKSSGTTSILTKVAAAHINTPKTPLPVRPKKLTEVPPGYGGNMLAGIEDEGLRRSLERLGAAIDAREASEKRPAPARQ